MGVFVDEGRRPASPLASGRAQVVSKHADCGLHAGVADEGDQVSGTCGLKDGCDQGRELGVRRRPDPPGGQTRDDRVVLGVRCMVARADHIDAAGDVHLVDVEAHEGSSQHVALLGVGRNPAVASDGHTAEEACGALAKRPQPSLHRRAGAVGVEHVVDDDEGPGGHHGQTAGQSTEVAQPGLDRFDACPADKRRGCRQRCRRDVVARDGGGCHVDRSRLPSAPPGQCRCQRQPVAVAEGERVPAPTDGNVERPGPRCHLDHVGFVGVVDGKPGRAEPVEEQPFGSPVRGIGAVYLQVIRADRRADADRKGYVDQALITEALRAGLDDGVGGTDLDGTSQQLLNLWGVGRAQPRGERFIARRSDQAGRQGVCDARPLHAGRQHDRRGGLGVRAGNPDRVETLCGEPLEQRG